MQAYKIVKYGKVDGWWSTLFHGIKGSKQMLEGVWYHADIRSVRDGSGPSPRFGPLIHFSDGFCLNGFVIRRSSRFLFSSCTSLFFNVDATPTATVCRIIAFPISLC